MRELKIKLIGSSTVTRVMMVTNLTSVTKPKMKLEQQLWQNSHTKIKRTSKSQLGMCSFLCKALNFIGHPSVLFHYHAGTLRVLRSRLRAVTSKNGHILIYRQPLVEQKTN